MSFPRPLYLNTGGFVHEMLYDTMSELDQILLVFMLRLL